MGRYATHTSWLPTSTPTATSDVNSLIPGLTSTIATTNTVNSEISRAEGFVDSFAGKLYLPSDYSTSPTIHMITEDIVTYRIFNNYIYNRPEGLTSNVKGEVLENRFTVALGILEQLRDGKMELYQSDGTRIAQSNKSSRFFISTGGFTPTFLEDGELGWRVSDKKLDSIEDQRELDEGSQ